MKYCTCEYWDSNQEILGAGLILLKIHGQDLKVKIFEYCPWCGILLKNTKPRIVPIQKSDDELKNLTFDIGNESV